MDGRPSDNRALDFSADISLIGPKPYPLYIRTDSFESVPASSIFQVTTKGLVMDAHRVTLKDDSPPGS